MPQESIPAKSTKNLEFRKYIVEKILKILENVHPEKDKNHFFLNNTMFVLKSGIGKVQILWSLSFQLNLRKLNLRKDKVKFRQ